MTTSKDGETPREVAWRFWLTSQMNVVYYETKIRRLRWLDTSIWVAAWLSLSASVLGFVSAVRGLAIASGVLATVLSGVGMRLRLPDKARSLGVLLAEYTGHVHTFEGLYLSGGGTEESLKAAVEAFTKTEAKDQPNPSRRLLEKSQAMVLRRIGT